MKKILILALVILLSAPSLCFAEKEKEKEKQKKHRIAARNLDASPYVYDPFNIPGKWILSTGLGLTISPTLFLLNPQFEYVIAKNLTIGPMLQVGMGDATLFAVTGTVRYTFNQNAKIKPSLEGGLGMAIGSSSYASSVGVNISMGMGCDYVVDRYIRFGTMIRGNFAPPLKTFYLSWPIVMARFVL